MQERLKLLVAEETINQTDSDLLFKIAKNDYTDISLMDLIELEKRFFSYLKSTTEQNKRVLYLGFIGIIKSFKSDWGTKSDTQYLIC